MKKAFTLIELMIVVAIIAIIAAIAIPNLMESKKSANEGNASTSLKTYCTAQATFQSNNYAPANNTAPDDLPKAFAETWQLLGGAGAGTNANGDSIKLIPPAFGDAAAAATAWNGYFYRDIPSTAADVVKYNHGLEAVPAQYGTTGTNTFIVNEQAQVYMSDLGDNLGMVAGGDADFDTAIGAGAANTWSQP